MTCSELLSSCASAETKRATVASRLIWASCSGVSGTTVVSNSAMDVRASASDLFDPPGEKEHLAFPLDVQHERLPYSERVDRCPERRDVRDNRAVDGVNHIARLQFAFPSRWSRAGGGRHDDSRRHAQVGKQLGERTAERQSQNSQALDQVVVGTNHSGKPVRIIAAFDHGDRDVEGACAPEDLQGHHVSDPAPVEVHLQLPSVLHGFAVEGAGSETW